MKGELKENLERVEEEVFTIRDAYDILVKIYKRYIDMDEKYYPVIACWVLGSFFQRVFPTYPYLFLNAMKGSGKSRFLRLTSHLTDGIYTVNITEAVLFRKNEPLFVDEIENISRKEKSGLRELLNVAYKKGGIVQRSRKIEKSGKIIVESFECYRPVALANITGLDDVLEDRCIKIVLEKSFNKIITRRMELFELDPDIQRFKKRFSVVLNSENRDEEKKLGEVSKTTLGKSSQKPKPCDLVKFSVDDVSGEIYLILQEMFKYYNLSEQDIDLFNLEQNYTKQHIIKNYTKQHNYTKKISILINRINESEILGRDLEVWLPIIVVAGYIGEDVLDFVFKTAEEYIKEKREEDIVENRDIILLGFLYDFVNQEDFVNDYILGNDLVSKFKENNPEETWFNSWWLGHALRRNKVLKNSRRVGRGVEYLLNVQKINEKAIQFGFGRKSEEISELKQETLNEVKKLTLNEQIEKFLLDTVGNEEYSTIKLIEKDCPEKFGKENQDLCFKILLSMKERGVFMDVGLDKIKKV